MTIWYGSKDLGILVVELSGDIRRLQIEITIYPDSLLFISTFFASGQFVAAELVPITTTKPLRRRQDQNIHLILQMSGDVHQNPGSATKYPCSVCTRNVTSRAVSYQCNKCSGWVHAICSGLLNAAQYRRSSDWACYPCWTPPQIPSLPSLPPTSTLSSD